MLDENCTVSCDGYLHVLQEKAPGCTDVESNCADDINGNPSNSEPDLTEENAKNLSSEKVRHRPTRFLQRTWQNVLGIRRSSSSSSSYDVDYDISTRSSMKEDCFSENEDRSDGIDSGIASEEGDRPASSTLFSCTNVIGDYYILLAGLINKFPNTKPG